MTDQQYREELLFRLAALGSKIEEVSNEFIAVCEHASRPYPLAPERGNGLITVPEGEPTFFTHIDQVPRKDAATLIRIEPGIDPYHDSIRRAATALMREGMGTAKYCTQWESGTTAWTIGAATATVSADGKVKIN